MVRIDRSSVRGSLPGKSVRPTDPANSEIRMIRAPDPYRFVLEQPMATAPDRVWNYSGGSTQLLAGIVDTALPAPGAMVCHITNTPAWPA